MKKDDILIYGIVGGALLAVLLIMIAQQKRKQKQVPPSNIPDDGPPPGFTDQSAASIASDIYNTITSWGTSPAERCQSLERMSSQSTDAAFVMIYNKYSNISPSGLRIDLNDTFYTCGYGGPDHKQLIINRLNRLSLQ